MLPLSTAALFRLALIAISLCAALAYRVGGRWKRLLWSVAVVQPILVLWFTPIEGKFAGLGVVIILCASLIAYLSGVALSAVLWKLTERRLVVVSLACLGAVLASARVLYLY